MNKSKKKTGFMKGLVRVVRSHFYDLFSKVYEEGTENAKEKHDVELPQGSVKEIIKDAIKRNKEAKPDWKATKAEVQEIINSGAKQAWAAIKNDKDGADSTDEDKFLASLDLDLDNLSDDDWKDILGEDFDEEDMGMESLNEKIQAQFQGAKDYMEGVNNFDPPEEEPAVVKTMTDNNITAALMLFLANVKKCPHFTEHFKTHHDEICKLIEGCNEDEYPVDQIDSGDDSNLVKTKELIKAVNEEMAPTVGYGSMEQTGIESDEMVEEAVTVIEEVPLNEQEAYQMSQERIDLLIQAGDTVSTIVNQIEDKATEEMRNIFSIWMFKLDRVARFCAALDGCSEDKYHQLFKEEMFDMCGVCDCVNIPLEVCIYFYLGLVPSKYIELGYRVCSAYLKVIED